MTSIDDPETSHHANITKKIIANPSADTIKTPTLTLPPRVSDNIPSQTISSRAVRTICHAKSYSLLRLFIEHVGIPAARSCYKLQPHRHAIDTKLMNWLLSDASCGSQHRVGVTQCWIMLENKLESILPILRKCNGDVNFVDDNGQTILHVFVKKYVGMVNKKTLPRDTFVKIAKLTKRLLEQGASVNVADDDGNTPMHYAAGHKIKLLITLLLGSFTNINAQNNEGNTVLHILADSYGAAESYKQIIYVLLTKNADANIRNKKGNTPVHLAAKHCLLETLAIFKKYGADFHLLGEKGKTMLHFVSASCLRGFKDELKKMKTIDFFAKEGCDVNDTNEDGYSALHYAASCYGSSKVIRKLIKLGANVGCRTRTSEETPLHVAVKCDCAAIETLLKFGADVDAMDVGCMSPLHYTIIYGKMKNMECLVRNGADVHRRGTIFSFTPVHMTALAGKSKLELLVGKGVKVNVKTRKGITPLHLAAMMGNFEVIEVLVNNGADVNCRDEVLGMTPLHWAAMKGGKIDVDMFVDKSEKKEVVEHWKKLFVEAHRNQVTFEELRNPKAARRKGEVMKILLEKGALLAVKDAKGHVPLYYVLENNNVEDLKCLLKHGADVNEEDISEKVVRSEDCEVKHHVLWHAMKLKQIGFPITSRYKFRTYHTDYWSEYRKCLDEVLALRSHLIGETKLSLYDFLHMNSTSRYAYVGDVLTTDPGEKFAWYCDIIMASCRDAVDRRLLLKPAKLALKRLTGLPVLCIEKILAYLNNEMLKAIVCSVKSNEKSQ